MKKLPLVFFLSCCLSELYFSQCCGGCSPIGGNTNLGTLPKYMLQFNSYYKYGYSAGYMKNDGPSDFEFVKDANSRFVGAQLSYGFLKRFTGQIDAGYYISRTQNFEFSGQKFTLTGQGGSSVTFSGKYCVVKDTSRELEWTVGAGARIPWSTQPQVVDGVELSEDVQPCNGAYGLVLQSFLFKEFDSPDLTVFMMNIVSINGSNGREYREGNTYITSLFVSKPLFKNISGILQIRNEIRDYCFRHNQKVASSGGYKFIFVPQLNYRFKEKYNLSVLYELPIYQYYYGTQLHDRYSFSVNLNIRIGLSKKANELCEKPK